MDPHLQAEAKTQKFSDGEIQDTWMGDGTVLQHGLTPFRWGSGKDHL